MLHVPSPKRSAAMLTFAFSAAKMKKGDLSIAKGHNLRTHDTESQLPKSTWLAKEAHYTMTRWNDEQAEKARHMAKRKDAVVGIEMTFQVGSQVDWREEPTKEHPHGKAKKYPANLKAMGQQIGKFLAAEFGAENVVSLELHMDESSPHFHAVVTPIKDGKLNAKHWMDGPARLSKLYERAHSYVVRAVPCEYVKGRAGGLKHDPSKRAGAAEPPGMIDKLMKLKPLMDENAQLKARVRQLEQLQFSGEKRRHQAALLDKAAQVRADAQQDRQKAAETLQEAENERGAAQGVRRALEAAKASLGGKVEKLQQDACYYEQTATELMAKNEKLAAELAAERERAGQLTQRLAKYEQPAPQPRRPGNGSSYEPG